MMPSLDQQRKQKTVLSAVWAAYGDALGFPTELANESLVRRRIGSSSVTTTVDWERLVGGKFGARVLLPAGAYSDDTQLRLATCRAIRGDGFFDVEAFAKIELPVWLSYALGGGLGSKGAAASLAQRTIAWFSNFYRTEKSTYLNGGGNGAAMRIQPHVWAATDLTVQESYLPDVVRNSVTTHGHVRGIAGAMTHAHALALVMHQERVPDPKQWTRFSNTILHLPEIIQKDADLSTFWRPTWENGADCSVHDASKLVAEEWREAVNSAVRLIGQGATYAEVVEGLGGLAPEERGSGLKSSLFALCASWMAQNSPEQGVRWAADAIGSDTDTIATMVGALMGALPEQAPPEGALQDRDYIVAEAMRMFEISQRGLPESFTYPDILYWRAPRSPLDAMGLARSGPALAGLGAAIEISQFYSARSVETVYQWVQLPFGQTVLCKRRSELKELPDGSLPKTEFVVRRSTAARKTQAPILARPSTPDMFEQASVAPEKRDSVELLSLDAMTDAAIRSDFDPRVIGDHIVRFAAAPNGIELAAAYTAIVVKAKMVRLRRGRPTT